MTDWQFAQLNIAMPLAPADSPQLAEFIANLDRINALADAAPGFVWRLQGDTGSAISSHLFGADAIVNMSVWADAESLHDYVYRSAHIEIMAKRKQWFEQMREAYSVLWWVPAAHRPTLLEAKKKLGLLRENGPSEAAFTFKKAFPAPGQARERLGRGEFDDSCPAT